MWRKHHFEQVLMDLKEYGPTLTEKTIRLVAVYMWYRKKSVARLFGLRFHCTALRMPVPGWYSQVRWLVWRYGDASNYLPRNTKMWCCRCTWWCYCIWLLWRAFKKQCYYVEAENTFDVLETAYFICKLTPPFCIAVTPMKQLEKQLSTEVGNTFILLVNGKEFVAFDSHIARSWRVCGTGINAAEHFARCLFQHVGLVNCNTSMLELVTVREKGPISIERSLILSSLKLNSTDKTFLIAFDCIAQSLITRWTGNIQKEDSFVKVAEGYRALRHQFLTNPNRPPAWFLPVAFFVCINVTTPLRWQKL